MADSPSDLPVNDVSDVLAVAPSVLRPDSVAPVRDGIFAGITALCQACQSWGIYAAAQSDPLRATGVYEDAIGGERSIFRSGALDEPYRDAILTPPTNVTPQAILAAANAILAPFTAVQAKYCESRSDRLFIYPDLAGPGPPAAAPPPPYGNAAFLYLESDIARSPAYADRLYESDAATNGGLFCPGREPGAARIFADDVGRMFLLRAPDLTSVDAQDTPVYTGLPANGDDFFVAADASSPITDPTLASTSYVLQNPTLSSTLYASLINAVAHVLGQSVRWELFVDPQLTS
jgi:hypothetical protein